MPKIRAAPDVNLIENSVHRTRTGSAGRESNRRPPPHLDVIDRLLFLPGKPRPPSKETTRDDQELLWLERNTANRQEGRNDSALAWVIPSFLRLRIAPSGRSLPADRRQRRRVELDTSTPAVSSSVPIASFYHSRSACSLRSACIKNPCRQCGECAHGFPRSAARDQHGATNRRLPFVLVAVVFQRNRAAPLAFQTQCAQLVRRREEAADRSFAARRHPPGARECHGAEYRACCSGSRPPRN